MNLPNGYPLQNGKYRLTHVVGQGGFGTGIPVYTYLETSRIMKTPAAYQGRSTALLRFVGIFLTLIMALVLGFFEGRVKSSVALYFSAGAIILLVIFCLVLLQSAREKNA